MRNMKSISLLILIGILSLTSASASSQKLAKTSIESNVKKSAKRDKAPSLDKKAEKAIYDLVSEYDNKETPGGVILVMRDGKVIYRKAFGMANLSHGIAFEPNTITNIGSTSKQFTGFALALLEKDGLLSLDDDVRKHIPELPEFEHIVTLRHLLSHTSGYREYINSLMMAGRFFGDVISRDEIIPMLQRQPALQSIPGESFMYNNSGFALLSMVIERVTDTSFATWMKENVFMPLNMTHTQVRENPGQIIAGSAQGYGPKEEGGFVEIADIGGSAGAGGIYTTVDDLAKWILNFYDNKLGGEDLMEKMQTPFVLNSGEKTTYGLGLMVSEFNGMKVVQHGGADAAHRSALMMFPEIRGAVITQSNHAAFAGNIAQKVAEICFADMIEKEEEQEKAVTSKSEQGDFVFDPKKFDDYAGRYALEVAPTFILEFSRDGDKLYTQATMQPKFEIFASSDSTFYLKVVEASVTFHRNAEGVVDAITLHQNGDNRANRIFEEAWKPSDEDIQQYIGTYFSKELEVFYRIVKDENNGLLLQHRRLQDIPLKAENKDEFTGVMPIISLNFVRDESGLVTGFHGSSGRSFGILFEKTSD